MYLTSYRIAIKRHLFVLMLLLVSFISQAQEISVSNYLGSLKNSDQVKNDSTVINFLTDYNYNIPLIKNVQFRIETRELIDRFQEYTIRVKPNSLWARSSQKKVYQNKFDEVLIKDQLKFNEELKKRYILVINVIFTEQLLVLYQEEILQLQDKLAVLGQSIYDEKFDVKDYLKTEEDLLELKLKIENLNSVKKNYLLPLQEQFSNQTHTSFSLNNLISEKEIIDFYEQKDAVLETPAITLQKIKLQTIDSEMRLTRAKSKQVFDFFQAKYLHKSESFFDQNISLGVGVNLPFFGNTREQKGEFYFKKVIEEDKLKDLYAKQKEDYQYSYIDFEASIFNFTKLQEQQKISSVSKLLENYKKIEGVSPIILLQLKLLKQKQKIALLKSKQELFLAYINVLSTQELLFQKPLKNYLSISKELLNF